MREKNWNAPTRFPLADGSHATITALAALMLEEKFGITRGRLKKGAGGNDAVVVSVASGNEVRLLDLLSVFIYLGHKTLIEDPDQKFILRDGDPLRLLPENITVTPRKPVEVRRERKTYTRKTAVVRRERPANALSIVEQERLLEEAFPKLRAVALAILRPESEFQADDVTQETCISLLQQIRSGGCHAENRAQFFGWALSAAQKASTWKLDAICSGVCKDVDHDRVEIKLLRVVRLDGDLKERAGVFADAPQTFLPEIKPAKLGQLLEADAKEERERERQRIKDEGGVWTNVDLESGTEVVADLEEAKPARNDSEDTEEAEPEVLEEPLYLPAFQSEAA